MHLPTYVVGQIGHEILPKKETAGVGTYVSSRQWQQSRQDAPKNSLFPFAWKQLDQPAKAMLFYVRSKVKLS